jgi:acyl-coenzyme A synthetase/AMP-(fatty) acid ligase
MCLAELHITSKNACFIICTSGTTGRQKAIVHTHGSLLASLQARINWEIKYGDKVLQLAASSWIIHLFEIFLPLVSISLGTLVLLRPGDNLNMDHLYRVIRGKKITILRIGSSMLKLLIDYLELTNIKTDEMLENVRILWTGGESPKVHYLAKVNLFMPRARIFMSYGLSEAMVATGCYLPQNLDEFTNFSNILPIGHAQPGYRCLLINSNNEQIIYPSCSDETGEIHIAGNILHSEDYEVFVF